MCKAALLNVKFLAGITLVTACFLLFFRLGHYALWDDEVGLAIPAKQVWLTGETRVVSGENIMVPREGVIVKDLKDKANPPLPAFCLAPFAATDDANAFLLRFPFALCGLFCVGLILCGAYLYKSPPRLMAILCIGIVGNISLFLYFRQVRYYGIAILLSTSATFVYLLLKKTPANLFLLGLLLAGVFASNYMVFAAFMAVLLLDYIIWQRHEFKFGWGNAIFLFAPLFLVSGLVLSGWNPYATAIKAQALLNTPWDRATLFWWNLRDMNANEFGSLCLLLVAPVAYFFWIKNAWLLRGPLAVMVYCLVLALVSPQPVNITSVADIRYAAPLIPLFIIITAVLIWRLTEKINYGLAVGTAVLVFWTSLFYTTIWFQDKPHSTILNYVGELVSPPPEPFTPTAKWIQQHVQKGQSIWVLPEYMTYPLMYHAPNPVYAWQLRPEQRQEEQFKNLPDIHFKGLVPPDFIVVFGPSVAQVRQLMSQWSMQGLRYQEVARLMTFWKDLYRPELFWRTFKPIEKFDPNTEAIYIYQKVS